MKAIIHVCESAPGLAALKHNYRGRATRSKPERYFEDSRVQAVVGDTCGLGVVPLKPGAEKSLLDILSGPNQNRLGKPLRQLILSTDDLPDDKPDGYYAMILAQLLKAAKKWVNRYARGCRWAAWAHQDRKHPHVHLVVENWDYARGKRLNLSPTLLEEIQSMEWCADLGIESGRGSRGQIEAGLDLLADGKLESVCTYQERIQIQAATRDGARMAVTAKIENWRRRLNVPPDLEAMQKALDNCNSPEGWAVRMRSKDGVLYRKPSVIIDGVSVRLNKFLEMRERLPSLASSAHIPGSTVLESVIAEPVMTAPFVEEPSPQPLPAPVVANPVVKIPLSTDSVVVEPVVVEPVVVESVVVEPVAAKPKLVTPELVTPELVAPAADQPVAPNPVVAEPVAAKPVAPEPMVEAMVEQITKPVVKPVLVIKKGHRTKPSEPEMEI